ncbi:Cleavage polyadenylation factor subunit fip1 [Microsporum ferrugineum]
MEEDDDDLYDPTNAVSSGTKQVSPTQDSEQQTGDVGMAEGDDYEEEEEEEEDEDDFKIITEVPPEVAAELVTQYPRHTPYRSEPPKSTADSASATPKAAPTYPVQKPGTPAASAKPTAPLKPGSSYPAHHTSSVDVSANPIHPSTNKPILSTDLDADFPTEDDKPWRRPGSDINDYFNYGFDEFTWASYCLKQQSLRKDINDQKTQMEDMQAFLSGGLPGMPVPGGPTPSLPGLMPGAVAGGGGGGGAGGGRGTPGPPQGGAGPGPQNSMPGMPPGMPELSPDMMQAVFAGMMAQGMDPSSMDPMTFMQHAQAMIGGGQPGAGTPQVPQTGYGGQATGQGFSGQAGGQEQMGYGGYDQHGPYGAGARGKEDELSNQSFNWKYLQAFRSVKNLAPLLDRVLVQRIKSEAKTASGIFLPESSVKELNEAKVLAVGPGALDKDGKRIAMSVAPGDRVLVPQVRRI